MLFVNIRHLIEPNNAKTDKLNENKENMYFELPGNVFICIMLLS